MRIGYRALPFSIAPSFFDLKIVADRSKFALISQTTYSKRAWYQNNVILAVEILVVNIQQGWCART